MSLDEHFECIVNEVYPIMQVVLPSAKSVIEVQPQFDEILKCPGSGIIVSGLAPPESGFDFYSRYFCPKLGINEVMINWHHDQSITTSYSAYWFLFYGYDCKFSHGWWDFTACIYFCNHGHFTAYWLNENHASRMYYWYQLSSFS